MALVVYALLLAFLAWETIISPLVPQQYLGPEPRRYMPHLGMAIGLGLGLAAFYWLPAGLDRSAVQLHNVAGPGYFDFHNYFITIRELLSPNLYFDLGATEPRFQYNLGLMQWLLALVGTATVFSPRLRRTDTFFFVFTSLIFVYLITQASVNFWEAVPLMSFFQFPTRFLGPAALVIAPLAGNAVRWADHLNGRRPLMQTVLGGVAIAGTLYSAMPLLYPPTWTEFGRVDAQRMISVEVQGRALGTTSANDFLPVGVSLVPGPQPVVLDSYAAGGPINRLNRSSIPEGAEVSLVTQRPYYDRYYVKSDSDFVFRMFLFYFPGWTARIDGADVPIEVAQPDGFITFPVPAGEHTVEVAFGETPARLIAWAISILALIGLAGAVAMAVKGESDTLDVVPMGWKPAAILAAVVLAGLGLKLAADGTGAFRFHSTGRLVEVAQTQYYVRLQREIQLLAYDVSDTTIQPGQQFSVTIYWKADAAVPMNFQVYVHLIGSDGQLYAQSDKLNPADFPTSRWPTTEYVRDEHQLVFVRPDPPPGEYHLVAGLWNAATGERLEPVTVDSAGGGVLLPTPILLQP